MQRTMYAVVYVYALGKQQSLASPIFRRKDWNLDEKLMASGSMRRGGFLVLFCFSRFWSVKDPLATGQTDEPDQRDLFTTEPYSVRHSKDESIAPLRPDPRARMRAAFHSFFRTSPSSIRMAVMNGQGKCTIVGSNAIHSGLVDGGKYYPNERELDALLLNIFTIPRTLAKATCRHPGPRLESGAARPSCWWRS